MCKRRNRNLKVINNESTIGADSLSGVLAGRTQLIR